MSLATAIGRTTVLDAETGIGTPGVKFFFQVHSSIISGELVQPRDFGVESDSDGKVKAKIIGGAVVTVSGTHPAFTTAVTITWPSAPFDLATVGALSVATIPPFGGMTVKDEGVALAATIGTFDFVGAGVAVVYSAVGIATVTIPGGSTGLTANRVMVTDVGGGAAASSVTSTTLAFLDATSSIQTQLNALGGLTVGTSAITSGTGGRVLYETAGNKLGEISGATSDGTTLTLIAPILGTPASGTLTSCTGLPPTTGIVGWPANSAGALTNDGAGVLTWVAAGANTALSNLASVSINTSLLAQSGVDLGSTTKPFRNAFLFGAGTYATTYIELTGTPTGTRVVTFPDSNTTVAIASQQITWAGLSTGRTITFPDAAITVARTDAGNTFTGNQAINGVATFTATARASGVAPYFSIVTPADTGQTLNTEFPGILFGGDGTGATVIRTGADGTTYALQREFVFVAPTYAFAGATTITKTATVSITGAPIVGTSATFTAAYALDVNGSILQTSTSATAFESGPNGSTNPTFRLVNSTASAASGLSITSLVSGAGILISALGGTNEGFTFKAKGSGGGIAGFEVRDGTNAVYFAVDLNLGGTVLASGSGYGWSNGFVTATRDTMVYRHGAAQVQLNNGTIGQWGALFAGVRDAGTTTVVNGATIGHQSTGTPAAGLGIAYACNLNSSTTADQVAAQFKSSWCVATHASRAAYAGIATNKIGSATLADKLIVGGHTVVATDAAALSLFEVALATLDGCAGMLSYEVYCTDATDTQVRRGVAMYSATQKATVYTSEIVIVSEAASCSAATTLTATLAIVTGASKITIQITPDTSVATPTQYYVKWQLSNLSDAVVTVL